MDIAVLGVRDLRPFDFSNIQRPFIEFDIAGNQALGAAKQTRPSATPSARNANFLQHIQMTA